MRLEIAEDDQGLSVVVEDDGRGMSIEECSRAIDPFYTDGTKHRGRKLGLGIPFLVQALEQCGGFWKIESERGSGTRISFRFPKESVDCPPLGELSSLFLSALCYPGDHELRIRRRRSHAAAAMEDYELRRSELADVLGGLELASSLASLHEFLVMQENG